MAFWKKSEDPWDIDPEKKKKRMKVAAEQSAEPEQTIPAWAQQKTPPEPMNCPWCGQPMLAGYLYSNMQRGSAMSWWEGVHKSFLELLSPKEGERYIDLGAYEEAWYCEGCQKMVMDVGLLMKKSGPNYVWKDGKVVFPDEEE